MTSYQLCGSSLLRCQVSKTKYSSSKMSKVFHLLGESFSNKDGDSIALTSIRGQGKVVAVYFSAHWCPPCRNFTPKLVSFYNKVKKTQNGDKFELIFLSSDKTEGEFKEYLNEMPWYALSYDKRAEKGKLSKHFKVSGIPTLIFLDGETGQVLNRNGRSVVDSDSNGVGFPWRAESLQDILSKDQYIANNTNEKKSFEKDIKGKVFGIYFSAHWCPPCKAFTPMLCDAYNTINKDEKKFEVIFVSSDQTEDAFKEYFGTMPFLALPYDSEIKDVLSDYFEVEGIPMLIILDGDGRVITSSGRAVVSGDKEGKKFPWFPEPVEVFDEVAGPKVNDEACLIYIPAGDHDAARKMKDILTPIGQESQDAAKKDDSPQDLFFFVAPDEGSTMVDSLCEFLNIEATKKSLFIVDVPAGEIYICETCQAEPVKEEVVKFICDYKNGALTAKNIRG